MIDAILFDKDGTLFDFRASWGRWASQFLSGLARNDAHARILGNAIGFDVDLGSFAPDSVVIAATSADIAAALLPHVPGRHLAELADEINDAASRVAMAEAVPLRPLLSLLRRRGLRLGVATNDSETPARAHLAAHDISDMFDFVAGYDSGYGSKPEPGMCQAFARAMNLDPGRIMMVGDSRHDLEAGRRAGMRPIAVLTGIAEAAELSPHAETVLASIADLPALLDGLSG